MSAYVQQAKTIEQKHEWSAREGNEDPWATSGLGTYTINKRTQNFPTVNMSITHALPQT